MTSLAEFLSQKGARIIEGHSGGSPGQTADLARLAALPGIRRIMEIGFNAGHSADTILSANPRAQLVSFDIGLHECVPVAKEYVDARYPGRHRLIIGDSQATVPRYVLDHPGDTFDMIFIDGGHEGPVPLADLRNCARLAHQDTIVIMDDIVYDTRLSDFYNVQPTQAWRQMIQEGRIVEKRYACYGHGRGQATGLYTLR
jgi:predicted O-methyltransferase YrrM